MNEYQTPGSCPDGYAQPPAAANPPPSGPFNPGMPLPQDPSAELPMNWFRFLTSFFLFAHAFFCVISAGGTLFKGFAGSHLLTVDPDTISATPDHLVLLCVIYYGATAVYLCLAGFLIFTRFQLVKYRKRGITMFYAATVVLLLLPNALPLLVQAVSHSLFISEDKAADTIGRCIGSLIALAIVLGCNVRYFNKRRALFH